MPTSTGCDAHGRTCRTRLRRSWRKDAVMLLEWPDRAGDVLPADRLDIAFTLDAAISASTSATPTSPATAHSRRASSGSLADPPLSAPSGLRRRRARAHAGRCLDARLRAAAARRPRAILMNAPRRPDGPPVRGGKPYSAIAHLAEDVTPFVAMARGLRERGFSAPEIYAADLDRRTADPRGPRHRRRGRGRSAGADRGALCGGRRRAGRRCIASPVPDALPVAPSVDIACRPTTSTRS